MKQTLVVPMRFESLNAIIEAGKTHWGKYAALKAQYTYAVMAYARAQLTPVKDFPVNFEFKWYEPNRRRDKDNIAAGKKFILDGLVKAMILPEDTWRYVGDFSDKFALDKSDPRVVVTLSEFCVQAGVHRLNTECIGTSSDVAGETEMPLDECSDQRRYHAAPQTQI